MASGWLGIQETNGYMVNKSASYEQAEIFQLHDVGNSQFVIQYANDTSQYNKYFLWSTLSTTSNWYNESGIGVFKNAPRDVVEPRSQISGCTRWQFIGSEGFLVCKDSTKRPANVLDQYLVMEMRSKYLFTKGSGEPGLYKCRFVVEVVEGQRSLFVQYEEGFNVYKWLGMQKEGEEAKERLIKSKHAMEHGQPLDFFTSSYSTSVTLID